MSMDHHHHHHDHDHDHDHPHDHGHGHHHGHDHPHPHGAGVADEALFRRPLDGETGRRFWRSLEERSGSPEFQQWLGREFPGQADQWTDPNSRRQFLRLMGASLALAGVSGCAVHPSEEIVPYVRQPEEVVPGKTLEYASSIPVGGYAHGVLVKNYMGRPIKVEGNPQHPATLGAADAVLQAAMLEMYDPDRSQSILLNARPSAWANVLADLTAIRVDQLRSQGAGLRILTGTVTSPTVARLLAALLEQLPQARWTVHEPDGHEAVHQGARLALGEAADAVLDLAKADVIVALDANPLMRGPARLANARAFASRRDPSGSLNRLYVAEPMPTVTGSMADHRLPATAARVGVLAQALAARLGGPAVAGLTLTAAEEKWLAAAAADLQAAKGKGVVLVGEDQPAEVQAIGHALNGALGNIGQTVRYIAPVEAVAPEGRAGTLAELVADMQNNKVAALVILGANPVFTAPPELNFARALDRVRQSVHLGLYEDETSELCRWHVPEAHPLESWGDARAFDGTATIQQPMIAPLYAGKTAIEVLGALLGDSTVAPLAHVRATWKGERSDAEFEASWKKALHDGMLPGTAAEARAVTARPLGELTRPTAPTGGELELVLRPDPTIGDGRYANNGWLQELSKPLTKLTWDNVAHVSPATAAKLGVANEDVVELRFRGRKLEAPVWVMPGHADDAVTLHYGYGRRRSGRVGTGVGVNAYELRLAAAPGGGPGLTVGTTAKTYELACTQNHQAMENRDLVRTATIGHFKEHPDFAHAHGHHGPELSLAENPEPQRVRQEDGVGNAWAMAINLNTCIGCGACTTACYAENNIPVVGKDQVRRGREMQWIRVDRYFEGSEANPRIYHQPVPCMHCEQAPCELVCPVAATSHSAEGLNEMTYNRCVGTRYCGNNCPYKVRRFNFLQYTDLKTPQLKLLNNPEVTVRTRGIMEKCTYCVQRISNVRIAVEKQGRTQVLDSDGLQTACQQACPTRAIVFGNMNDKASQIAKAREDSRNYALLAELNTRPRTTYLARLTNPHPQIEAE
jgi:molybdopterin-containing oxidoreductase family iron-sulfur binding subunit